MRILWNVLKFALVLALAIPVAIIILATALGIFATLLGLAILALRIAIVGLLAWGAYRVGKVLFRGLRNRGGVDESRQLVPVRDRYYEEAKRELDRELGHI